MGPHWFGPICCVGLLTGATLYFGRKAYHTIGIGSAAICLLFYITALVSLFIVSCSDPGVVKAGSRYEGVPSSDVSAGRGWRYCDLCSCHQPPGAVHCPDCNVCIEGYDHHWKVRVSIVLACNFVCSIRCFGDFAASFDISLPALFDCFCNPLVLTYVTICSFRI